MINTKTYLVHAGWLHDETIGTLVVTQKQDREYPVFTYFPSWLEKHSTLFLDPDLLPTLAPQVPSGNTFHFLEDASPNLWGKILIHQLCFTLSFFVKYPSDYLTLSPDVVRTGGIRISEDNEFITPSSISMPFSSLKHLQDTAWQLENRNMNIDDDSFDSLYMASASLGGSRPKASVIDEFGNSWIAKFQSKKDAFSIEQWEMVTHDLALLCGLQAPEAKLLHFENTYIFLVKRFDRAKDKRIHFASAMTFLNGKEGEHNSTFLDLAGTISTYSANPDKDCQELWRRMVFGLLVSNTDCHLRNHGFVLKKDGWHLSPMYDVNPNPCKTYFSLPIAPVNFGRDIITAVKNVAPYFSIVHPKEEMERMQTIIHDNYSLLADEYDISRSEQEKMAFCFGL